MLLVDLVISIDVIIQLIAWKGIIERWCHKNNYIVSAKSSQKVVIQQSDSAKRL